LYDHYGPSLKVLQNCFVKKLDYSHVENDLAASASTIELWKAIHNVPTELWRESATRSFEGAPDWMSVGTDKEPAAYPRFFLVRPVKDAERWTPEPHYTLDLITEFMGRIFCSAVQQKDVRRNTAFASYFVSFPSIRGLILKESTIRYLTYADSPSTVFMAKDSDNLEIPRFLTTHPELLNFKTGMKPPKQQWLHVSPIGAATIDGLYEMKDGKILLLQMTIAQKLGIADVGLQKILACYRSKDPQISLVDFVLVFVVPDEKTKDQYLKDWVDGRQVKLGGGQVQSLRVGVVIINDMQAKPLQVSRLVYLVTPGRNYSKITTTQAILRSSPRMARSRLCQLIALLRPVR
jgi:hypothetical protein